MWPDLEEYMKMITILAAILAMALASTTPADAAPICLKTYLINSTKVVDSKTIDFRMTNGTVYRNALRSPCSGLNFNGFVYETHTGEICDNLQTIRVLRTHQVCMLGAFTKLLPVQPKNNH